MLQKQRDNASEIGKEGRFETRGLARVTPYRYAVHGFFNLFLICPSVSVVQPAVIARTSVICANQTPHSTSRNRLASSAKLNHALVRTTVQLLSGAMEHL